MFIYYVIVQADFIIPVRQVNAPQNKPFVGFFMEFGCTVSDSKMLDDFIKHYVEKGHEGNIASIHKVRVENIPADKIRKWILTDEYISQSLLQDPLSEGIWYTTGHGYFWNDPWYSRWYIWVFAALSLFACGLIVGRYFL